MKIKFDPEWCNFKTNASCYHCNISQFKRRKNEYAFPALLHRLLDTFRWEHFFSRSNCCPRYVGRFVDRHIRPILSDRCFACHGPDAQSRESDLRLDVFDGPEGAHAWVIEPGSVEDSEFWNRITTDDDSELMPPPDSHKPPLSDAERQLIKTWIESGAAYEKFWAFEFPLSPAIPPVKNLEWSQQPIDLHVLSNWRVQV